MPARPATAPTSVIERYLPLAAAADIGAEHARAFRRTWGMVDFAPGCPTQ